MIEVLSVGGESFLSSGFGRFSFFVHAGSGFQIIALVNFVRSFQFSFLPLVKVLVNDRL